MKSISSTFGECGKNRDEITGWGRVEAIELLAKAARYVLYSLLAGNKKYKGLIF